MATNRIGRCPRCNQSFSFTPGEKLGWVAGAALGAGVLGGATKHPIAALVGGIVGAAIGHAAEIELTARCPQCKMPLEIISRLA